MFHDEGQYEDDDDDMNILIIMMVAIKYDDEYNKDD